MVSRRTNQKPVTEGGWNMFFTNWVAADVMNPVVNFSIGGRGKNGGWFGWAEDAKIEQLQGRSSRVRRRRRSRRSSQPKSRRKPMTR